MRTAGRGAGPGPGDEVRIDLADIAGTPGARGRYAISEVLDPSDDLPVMGPVTGEITVENAGSLLLLRGQLRARLRLSCVRCLTESEREVEIAVEEEFATDLTAPDVETIDRDEPERAAISDYVLDVSELVRQQVALSVPMAFVCEVGCRGICPTCGKNLNEGPCACPGAGDDSRWDVLKGLLPRARDKDD